MFAENKPKDKDNSGLPQDPRERLKELPSVSREVIEDFNRGMILGRLEKIGYKMKYPSWGFYPKAELEELTTVAIVFLVYHDNLGKEPKIKHIELPEASKHQNMLRSKGMYAQLAKKG